MRSMSGYNRTGTNVALVSTPVLTGTQALFIISCALICVSCAASKKETERQSQIDTDYQMAVGYYENNQTPQAIRSLALVLANDPNHAEANHLMGFIRLGRGQYEEAVKHFKKALETKPDSPRERISPPCSPGIGTHCDSSGSAKRAYSPLNCSNTSPTAPLRCFAMIISAMPRKSRPLSSS